MRTKRPTDRGDLVLDVILVEPNLWWVGYHRASFLVTRRAGGIFDEISLPYEAVSRAYLKMEEALRWSRMPVRRGERACEIGCAPGGSCQALLNRGLQVLGIDPAEMHPAVFDHPNFRHLRMRGNEVKRRELRGVSWLMTDMNVAPKYTLDTVEDLVTHDDVDIQGMLLTLKLLDWKHADDTEEYRARVQSWGFSKIRMRQMQHNRREFCLFAQR
jgi:23S rRNA (cytidine2498-2'-O)-methyltransferase